jgi:hypothetical protein
VARKGSVEALKLLGLTRTPITFGRLPFAVWRSAAWLAAL